MILQTSVGQPSRRADNQGCTTDTSDGYSLVITGTQNVFKSFRQGHFPPNRHTHASSAAVLIVFPKVLPYSHFLGK